MKRSHMLIAAFVITGIIGLGHLVVYAAFTHSFRIESPIALRNLRALAVALSASFTILTILTMHHHSRIANALYTISSVWLGTLYWLFGASVLGALSLGVGHGSQAAHLTAQALFMLAIGISIGGIINSNITRVTPYAVAIKNLPEAWAGKKIAVVSDTHLGNVRGHRFAEKIVRMVNEENPEIVLIAGDFFDGPVAPYEKLASPLRGILAPKGVYFSQGNHEEFQPSDKYDRALELAGVRILSNTKEVIDGIEIIGINYNVSNGDAATEKVLGEIGVRRDIPSFLIKHAPTGTSAVREAGIDLQVSGHTHRGQMWPFHYLTKKIFGEFEYGLNVRDDLSVVTCSGAGTWGPPQRVGTRSEIVIITLTQK